MSHANIQLHAIISGRVQGVSFRYYTKLTANSLGITGWVRNLPDATVEVWAEGSPTVMRQFENFLAQGPTGARVDSVDSTYGEGTGTYSSFEITYFAG